MNGADRPGQVGEDARLELAMAAASAERSNRPRHLVVGACVVLVLALVYLLVAMGSRGSAQGTLQRARGEVAGLRQVVSDIQQTKEVGMGDRYAPNNRVVPYLEGLAKRRVGLEMGAEGVTQQQGGEATGPEGFVQRSYRARLTEQDPLKLLSWVDLAVRAEPISDSDETAPVVGLEVSMLKLTPGHTDEADKVRWNLEVTFKRWERKD